MTKPLCVFVRLELEPESRPIFLAALDAAQPDVRIKQDQLDDAGPWLMITDRPLLESSSNDTEPRTATVVIAVDVERPADVQLPRDATVREISLAIGLCAEIARLRFASHQQSIATDEIRRLAQTDPLTDLPNRRAWEENLQQILEQAQLSGQSLSLGVVDLDHFKQVNDRAGHQIGDEVLRAAAASLRDATRAGDLLARLGGDEFAVVLRGIARDASDAVWERIRTALAAATCKVVGHPVTCSIGYVWLTPDASADQESLLATADAALRQAKQSGRNRVVAADEYPPEAR